MRINDHLESKSSQNPSVFKFGQNDIRVYQRDNDPWFVASDVAKCLGIQNPKDALKNLRPSERWGLNPQRGGTLSLISESGLYTIILRSKSAIREGTPAYNFRVWVTDELLPSIRKNGMYIRPFEKGRFAIVCQILGDAPHDNFLATRRYPQQKGLSNEGLFLLPILQRTAPIDNKK